MFSKDQKIKIAEEIEKLLLSFNHPEMPDSKPIFKLHVDGKESWSWADIEPNWIFDDGTKEIKVNPWNESNAIIYKEGDKGKGPCPHCKKITNTTIKKAPFMWKECKYENVLQDFCDECGSWVSIPHQSIIEIRKL